MPAPRGKLPEVWPSGQRQQTVNLSGKALRWFESIRLHHLPGLGGARGSNSGVESQPSKLLVAGSNPVSRSTPRGAPAWSGRRDSACIARCERCGLANPLCVPGPRGASAWSGRRDSAFGARFRALRARRSTSRPANPLCMRGPRGGPAFHTGCAGVPAGCRRRRLQDAPAEGRHRTPYSAATTAVASTSINSDGYTSPVTPTQVAARGGSSCNTLP